MHIPGLSDAGLKIVAKARISNVIYEFADAYDLTYQRSLDVLRTQICSVQAGETPPGRPFRMQTRLDEEREQEAAAAAAAEALKPTGRRALQVMMDDIAAIDSAIHK